MLIPFIFYKGSIENKENIENEFDLGSIKDNKYINLSMNIEIDLEPNWEIIDNDNLLSLIKADKNNIVIGCNKEQISEFKSSKKDFACPVGFNDKDTFSKVIIIIKKVDNDKDPIYDMIQSEVYSIEENSERKFNILKKKNYEIAGLSYENYRATSSYYELKTQLDYYGIIKNGYLYMIRTYYTNSIGCNDVSNLLDRVRSIN